MNEIVQKLLTLDVAIQYVIFGFAVGFVTLVCRLLRLVQQKWFAYRFHMKYTQTVKNLNNEDFDQKSHQCYQWLQRNLCILKKHMREHGVGNVGYISSTITHLHDRPDILPPNMGTVSVYLEQYTGVLNCLIRKMLLLAVCVPSWPIQIVELFVIMLRGCGIDSSNSKTRIIKIVFNVIFYAFTFIANWDSFKKKLLDWLVPN